jgi:hypothetical protein
MRKICTGPMQFTPYRPWSEERKAAARARMAGVVMSDQQKQEQPLSPAINAAVAAFVGEIMTSEIPLRSRG